MQKKFTDTNDCLGGQTRPVTVRSTEGQVALAPETLQQKSTDRYRVQRPRLGPLSNFLKKDYARTVRTGKLTNISLTVFKELQTF